MKCEKCGNELSYVNMLRFNYDGSDSWVRVNIQEHENESAIIMDIDHNWTGYGLSEEEQRETIICPHCEKFPFDYEEVQVHEIVRAVCFRTGYTGEEGDAEG